MSRALPLGWQGLPNTGHVARPGDLAQGRFGQKPVSDGRKVYQLARKALKEPST